MPLAGGPSLRGICVLELYTTVLTTTSAEAQLKTQMFSGICYWQQNLMMKVSNGEKERKKIKCSMNAVALSLCMLFSLSSTLFRALFMVFLLLISCRAHAS